MLTDICFAEIALPYSHVANISSNDHQQVADIDARPRPLGVRWWRYEGAIF